MILTWSKIISEFKKGNITIAPFDENMVNPNSYNYRIWNKIKRFSHHDGEKLHFIEEDIPDSWYILVPHQMYLASTFETIGSNKYMTSLIGRSSLGRLWLFLQLSANIWHTWTCHNRTLELVSTKAFIIYPFMKIGQVSFWVNDGVIDPYKWLYKNYNIPTESLLNK